MRYRVLLPAEPSDQIPHGAVVVEYRGRPRGTHGRVYSGRDQYGELCAQAVRRGLAAHQPGWSIAQISRSENVVAHALARKARRSRDDVSVCLDTDVADALIELAGITELTSGHWRVAPGRHATSISVALDAALVKLASGGANAAS